MPRKRIHPNQPIGLPLTAKERKLLVDDCLIIENTYLDRIREASANRPEVPFTLDELDDLHGHVAFEANHAKSRKKQKALDVICGRIQHLLETHTDEQESPDPLGQALAGRPAVRDIVRWLWEQQRKDRMGPL